MGAVLGSFCFDTAAVLADEFGRGARLSAGPSLPSAHQFPKQKTRSRLQSLKDLLPSLSWSHPSHRAGGPSLFASRKPVIGEVQAPSHETRADLEEAGSFSDIIIRKSAPTLKVIDMSGLYLLPK